MTGSDSDVPVHGR